MDRALNKLKRKLYSWSYQSRARFPLWHTEDAKKSQQKILWLKGTDTIHQISNLIFYFRFFYSLSTIKSTVYISLTARDVSEKYSFSFDGELFFFWRSTLFLLTENYFSFDGVLFFFWRSTLFLLTKYSFSFDGYNTYQHFERITNPGTVWCSQKN